MSRGIMVFAPAALSTLGQAARSLRRAPGLAVAAVLCVGLGTAATTTVATLVSAALLRPVPFPNADRLVRIWFEEPGVNPRISLAIPDVADFAQLDSFDAFVGTARVRTTAQLKDGTERLRGEGVSRGYFELLGLRPAIGRLLQPSDHAPGAPPAMVLSHGTWQRVYGSDATIVGREIRTEADIYTIVGVAERGFQGTVEDDIVEFFVPIERYEPRPLITSRMSRPAWVIGRLKPARSIDVARQEADRVRAALFEAYPDIYRRWRVNVEPFGESWRQRLRGGGMLLFGAAALLLLVAGANVGCLLLARVLDRRREMAVRAALGAGRGRLFAQLVVEALLLVSAGGVLGALAGPSLLKAFLAVSPLGRLTLPTYLRLEPDLYTLALAIATLGVAGLLAGTAPALLGQRVAPADVLREGSRGMLGRPIERRWGAVLIGGEVALTLVLLVAGGLFVRSYARLSTLDMGFDRKRIARLAVTFSRTDAGDRQQLPAMYARLKNALAAVPGVTRVGFVYPTLPPWDGLAAPVRLEGVELPQAPDGLSVGTHLVDEGLFPTLGARVIAGRNIEAADAGDSSPVAVISESVARLFGGADRAIGRSMTFVRDDPPPRRGAYRVVGVVEDIAYDGLIEEETRRFVRGANGADVKAARHDVYLSLAQFPTMLVSIGASTKGDPSALLEPLRRRMAEVAPTSAAHWISTMDDEVALEYEPTRFYTILVAAFSSSALALTSLGLFALLSHAAARRTSEMGLRLVLGASRASAAWLVVRSGLVPLGLGLAGGGVVVLAMGQAMSALIYGITPFDPLTLAAAACLLLAVALAASLIPARRIATIDPAIAMRTE